MKVERRGGYRGGSKPGNYSWAKPHFMYTYQEQVVRDAYLTDFKDRINSYRSVMKEKSCNYQDDDSSYETMLYSIKAAAVSANMKTYVPTYPVRYQEYLKGNNGLQAL